MPVYGLPAALESSLNSLLHQQRPTSWRVSGHSEDITVVLRWTASKMWPAGASSSKEWPATSSKEWPVAPTALYSTEKQSFDFNNVPYFADEVFCAGTTSSSSSKHYHGQKTNSKSNSASSSSSSSSSPSSSLSSTSSSQTHKISSSSKKRKRKHSESSSCSSSGKGGNGGGDRDRNSSRLSTPSRQTPTSSGIYYSNANNHCDNMNSTNYNVSKSNTNNAKSGNEKATKSIAIESVFSTKSANSTNNGSSGTSSHLGSSTGSAAGISDPYPVYITSSESVIRNDLIMQDDIHNHSRSMNYSNHHHRLDSTTDDYNNIMIDDSTYSPDLPESKYDTKDFIVKVSSINNEEEILIDTNNANSNYSNQYEEWHSQSNQESSNQHHSHKHHKSNLASRSNINSVDTNTTTQNHKSAFKSHNNSVNSSHNEKSKNSNGGGTQRKELPSPNNSNFYSVVAKALQKDPESSSNAGNGSSGKRGGRPGSRGGSKIHRQASFDNSDVVLVERGPSSVLSDDDEELKICSVEVLENSE